MNEKSINSTYVGKGEARGRHYCCGRCGHLVLAQALCCTRNARRYSWCHGLSESWSCHAPSASDFSHAPRPSPPRHPQMAQPTGYRQRVITDNDAVINLFSCPSSHMSTTMHPRQRVTIRCRLIITPPSSASRLARIPQRPVLTHPRHKNNPPAAAAHAVRLSLV